MVTIRATATLALALACAACGRLGEAVTETKAAAPKPTIIEPTLRPGFWEGRTALPADVASFVPGGVMVVQTCVDKATAQNANIVRGGRLRPANGDCGQTYSRRPDGSWKSTTTCRLNGFTKITDQVVRGDLATAYTVESIDRYEGPPPPGEYAVTETTVTTTRLGDCPAEFKPGDMRFNGGKITNAEEIARGINGANAAIRKSEQQAR